MSIYTYILLCVCVYIYNALYILTYYTYIHTYIHMYISQYHWNELYIHTDICIYSSATSAGAVHTYIHTYICIYRSTTGMSYTYIRISVYIVLPLLRGPYIHTYIHTYICMYRSTTSAGAHEEPAVRRPVIAYTCFAFSLCCNWLYFILRYVIIIF